MNMVPAIGATCLGIVIGWLMRYFLFRFSKFTPQILGACVSLVVGGGVVRFLEADKTAWWFYPIGVFLGFVLYSLAGFLSGGPPKGTIYHTPMQEEPEETNQESNSVK